MGEPFMQRPDRRFDDVAGSTKIGFANFQVNDLFPLGLQSAGAHQNLKSEFLCPSATSAWLNAVRFSSWSMS